MHSFKFLSFILQVDDVPLDDVPRVIGNYDICVVKTMPLKADLISRASRMKLIMQYGVGLEGYLLFLPDIISIMACGCCFQLVYTPFFFFWSFCPLMSYSTLFILVYSK